MKTTILFGLALVALSVPARAQTPDPEPTISWTVAVFQPVAIDAATAIPVRAAVVYSLVDIPTTVTCGLTPKVVTGAGTLVNPKFVRWDDPTDATKDCQAPVSAQVQALPVGSYKMAAVANGATKQSTWSNFTQVFSRATTAPGTPTGVRATAQ